jgi:exopolysaccharide biosynthesis protein
MNKPKRTKIKSLIAALILILGGISYLLADRYLIQHVEVTDVSAATVITAEATTSASSGEPSNIPTSADSQTVVYPGTTSPSTDSATTSEPYFVDDWNYTSDSLTISIKKVSAGSGQDTLTYFVADVVISDATQLSNAFADDMFGRNIIETTSQIASDNNAIFAINGDYYGFREDGIIIRNGVIYRDVPTRIGLAFYLDGSMKIYDETETSAEKLLADGVWNTLSFGPALLVDSIIPANLTQVEVDHNFGNHSIQGNQPRTGIGIIDANHYVFIVVDGRSTSYSRGANLTEFAQMFKDLGCTDAYNIDGGGSSTMYFMGRVVNNPLGRNKERGTSDILFIG